MKKLTQRVRAEIQVLFDQGKSLRASSIALQEMAQMWAKRRRSEGLSGELRSERPRWYLFRHRPMMTNIAALGVRRASLRAVPRRVLTIQGVPPSHVATPCRCLAAATGRGCPSTETPRYLPSDETASCFSPTLRRRRLGEYRLPWQEDVLSVPHHQRCPVPPWRDGRIVPR